MSEAIYENKIVTWLDILGFTNVISETCKTLENGGRHAVNSVKEVFDEINQIITDYFDAAAIFSDNILIVSNPRFESNLYRCIKEIHILLLKNDLLLRGAMVRGDVYTEINKTGYLQAFGPAIIKAIELEKQATYPRVLVDESVLGLHIPVLSDGHSFTIKSFFKDFGLIEDFDGLYFVDYLTAIRLVEDKSKREERINGLEELLTRGSNCIDINISTKYKWLRNHWANVKAKNVKVDI